jgi:hypothetical protein
MKPIPITPETLCLARNIVWFEAPEEALADPVRFMAYAMTYALPEDMRLIRRYVSDDDFREALDHAPPGIIDPRSWAYWNSKMGRYPPPPAPVRRFAHLDTAVSSHEGEGGRRTSTKEFPPDERRAKWRAKYRPGD